MLPARSRLRKGADFTTCLRRGRRSGSPTVVVHVSSEVVHDGPCRVGFVVSKAVGNSVVRHRVQRRLRHVMAARLGDLPAGRLIVVRANPRAATADSSQLTRDVLRCLAACKVFDGAPRPEPAP